MASEKIPKILWKNLVEFFKNPKNFEVLYAIKQRTSRSLTGGKISLRVIEFFLTNYVVTTENVSYIVATHPTNDMIIIEPNSTNDTDEKKNALIFSGYALKLLNVHAEYKRNISLVYHKKMFDPCNRGNSKDKFKFKGPSGLEITTSLKQLVFFRWAIENGICEWLHMHAQKVIAAMKAEESAKKTQKGVLVGNLQTYKPRLHTLKRKRELNAERNIAATKPMMIIDNSKTNLFVE